MEQSPFKNMSTKKIAILAVLVVTLLAVIWGFALYQQQSYRLSAGVPSLAQRYGAPMMQGDSLAFNEAYDKGVTREIAMMPPVPTPQNSAPAEVSKIIKNADLTLLVEEVDVAAKLIDSVRAKHGGQIGNASFSEYASSRAGDITIWVPSDAFDVALSEIKVGALRVIDERITVTDVSRSE